MTTPSLIPWPAVTRFEKSTWLLPRKLSIQSAADFESEASLFSSDLRSYCKLSSVLREDSPHIRFIRTTRSGHPESYTLEVRPNGVVLEAGTGAGLYRGTRTLLQWIASAQDGKVRCGRIEDTPRCDWRGLMLDVSRHFFTVAEVKKFIDRAAMHKLNIFHWHLTDDQGWRFPVSKYPLLTEMGGWREESLVGHQHNRPFKYDGKRHGGSYTIPEIREVVAYAAARHITVVPEIDMPGHMQAALTAYPELGSGFCPGVRCHWGVSQNILHPSDKSMRFIRHVLDEVMDVFPSHYIHTGGDEALNHEWGESKAVQRFMVKHAVPNQKALQVWFSGEVTAYLRKHGRRMIGWDEIQEMADASDQRIPKDIAVMNWRDSKHGSAAIQRGNDVILTPQAFTYFDYYQNDPANEPLAIGGLVTLEKVYSFVPELSGAETGPGKVLGAQAQLWTEYMPNFKHLMTMTWPRATALSEVLWTPQEQLSWKRFLKASSGS